MTEDPGADPATRRRPPRPARHFVRTSYDDGPDEEVDSRSAEAWVIEPDDEGDGWLAYVQFAEEAEERGEDFATEHEALAAARRTLRAVDRGIDQRLEFDPEADGTGISSGDRDDLVRALQAWDLVDG